MQNDSKLPGDIKGTKQNSHNYVRRKKTKGRTGSGRRANHG